MRWIMTDKELQSIFSSNIKRYRLSRNLSQATLAEELDISVNHLCNIENGKRWLSVKILVKIAVVLRAEPYELFKSTEALVPDNQAILTKYIDETEIAVSQTLRKMRNLYQQHGSTRQNS